jgi:hypothetical protein
MAGQRLGFAEQDAPAASMPSEATLNPSFMRTDGECQISRRRHCRRAATCAKGGSNYKQSLCFRKIGHRFVSWFTAARRDP